MRRRYRVGLRSGRITSLVVSMGSIWSFVEIGYNRSSGVDFAVCPVTESSA